MSYIMNMSKGNKARLTWKKKMTTATTQPTIAAEILNQMGGSGRLAAMVGARDFVNTGRGLRFRFQGCKAANVCHIVLDADDTYTVEFYSIRGINVRKVSEESGHFCDTLRPYFETVTGLYLSL